MLEAALRRSAQEVEIDHLLAEEFACDPGFAGRFVKACGLPDDGLRVTATVAEPSLGGDGFGDLLVEGTTDDGRTVALLVEDKITAGPAVRQAARYAAFADVLRGRGVDCVWTILVAPVAYRGERDGYDAGVSLEAVAAIIEAADPVRRAYRRGVVERALAKKAGTGVRLPDPAMHRLKAAYLHHAASWCAREGLELTFPSLRDSYYDGDSWVSGITHPSFPPGVTLRHRLWTTTQAARGQVDLITVPATDDDRQMLTDGAPAGAVVAPYSAGRGIQVSFSVPEMRQHAGFDGGLTDAALSAMRVLTEWRVSLATRPER